MITWGFSWCETTLWQSTLRNKNSQCVCLGFFQLSLGHVDLFSPEQTTFITELKIIYSLIQKKNQAIVNRNF